MVKKSRIEMNQEEADLIDKWIFLLLAANNNEPIKGRVRFMKEFFLFAINHNKKLFDISEFYPYHFGPYSTRVAFRMNFLKTNELIGAEFKNQDWEYFLTEEGLDNAKKSYEETSNESLDALSIIKNNNKRLSLKDLLKEIYVDYPKYALRSIIKEEITKEKIKPEDLIVIDDGPGFVSSVSLEEEEIELKEEAAKRYLELISK
ncbi:MAG: hypothetical protein ACFFDF_21210 [Candidatus Odinarchaeota archaeon]